MCLIPARGRQLMIQIFLDLRVSEVGSGILERVFSKVDRFCGLCKFSGEIGFLVEVLVTAAPQCHAGDIFSRNSNICICVALNATPTLSFMLLMSTSMWFSSFRNLKQFSLYSKFCFWFIKTIAQNYNKLTLGLFAVGFLGHGTDHFCTESESSCLFGLHLSMLQQEFNSETACSGDFIVFASPIKTIVNKCVSCSIL